MLSSDDIKRRLGDITLLDLDDKQLCAEFEELLGTMDEHDRQVSETLDQLLAEVDDLLILADEVEVDEIFCR
ncbi:MAG: hypothetical protein U9N48_06325 [Euryarchaeota archaeon]|nr:hypothetical protein [Euryarchaeota archaeon]